jgi:glycosyltransferase involved in cell wall biosynthesis
MTGVSVIICCHNSRSLIVETLDALARQEVYGIPCEILLVDNNCTDDTWEIAKQNWINCNSPFPLRRVFENRLGLNFAREAGIRASTFSYAIFCDDDNRLCQKYIKEVFHEFETEPAVGILGGWSEGEFESTVPSWFYAIQYAYAIGGKPESERANVHHVWGAGMAIRTEIALKIFAEGLVSIDRSGRSPFIWRRHGIM